MVSDEEQWKKVLLGKHRAVAFIMLNTDSSTSVKIVTKLIMVLNAISDLFIEQVDKHAMLLWAVPSSRTARL